MIMRYLYTLIFYLALPFILLRLLWRSRKVPEYRQRWKERFGFVPVSSSATVWLHAVSFGEARLATTLARQLKKSHPEIEIVVTTMTVTGSKQIQKTLDGQVLHTYLPYDYPAAIQRFLDHMKPQLLIVLETELWPNILHYTGKRNIPIMIANARLSERSARGYRWIGWLTRAMLRNVTTVLAQTREDADRFVEIGLNPDRARVTGNLKFDISPPMDIQQQAQALRRVWGENRPVWVAASTHSGEEEIILQAFAQVRAVFPQLLLLLVPRHPERFDAVAALCEQQGFQVARRSKQAILATPPDIYLGDSMGEMWLFYAAANIAFVGGSLAGIGGHNLLEPAALGLPIITGPHLFHFTEIFNLLNQASAIHVVRDATQLANVIIQLIQNKETSLLQGERAKQVVAQNQGSLAKHLEWIDHHVSASKVA